MQTTLAEYFQPQSVLQPGWTFRCARGGRRPDDRKQRRGEVRSFNLNSEDMTMDTTRFHPTGIAFGLVAILAGFLVVLPTANATQSSPTAPCSDYDHPLHIYFHTANNSDTRFIAELFLRFWQSDGQTLLPQHHNTIWTLNRETSSTTKNYNLYRPLREPLKNTIGNCFAKVSIESIRVVNCQGTRYTYGCVDSYTPWTTYSNQSFPDLPNPTVLTVGDIYDRTFT